MRRNGKRRRANPPPFRIPCQPFCWQGVFLQSGAMAAPWRAPSPHGPSGPPQRAEPPKPLGGQRKQAGGAPAPHRTARRQGRRGVRRRPEAPRQWQGGPDKQGKEAGACTSAAATPRGKRGTAPKRRKPRAAASGGAQAPGAQEHGEVCGWARLAAAGAWGGKTICKRRFLAKSLKNSS